MLTVPVCSGDPLTSTTLDFTSELCRGPTMAYVNWSVVTNVSARVLQVVAQGTAPDFAGLVPGNEARTVIRMVAS